ncbi:hypothetical protein CAPTEDRAFT_36025, partial [Capitella teleta]
CKITYDRSYLNTSSLVLFHSRDFNAKNLPDHRMQDQRFIFMSLESPTNTWMPTHGSTNTMFNMTMTYMRSSDIVIPYGSVIKSNNTSPEVNYAKNKDKGILWYVSNCSPKIRRNFAKDLSRLVDVDIFGGCGKRDPCKRNQACLKKMMNRYRFYLAFENSLCTDYITEKFWKALDSDMVPIVMGASFEEYQKVAPPLSFIHVNQFTSLEELSAHLIQLQHDDGAYNKYMAWKRNFTVKVRSFPQEAPCLLCSEAQQRAHKRPPYNLKEWWN